MSSRICGHCGTPARAEAKYCPACGKPLLAEPAPDPFALGASVGPGGRYRIERQIGRGGFGAIYLAADTSLADRLCVLKRLVVAPQWTPEQQAMVRELFRRETNLLAAINARGHPHIPDIYDYLPELECYVLKFVTGQSLHQVLEKHPNGLPETEALAHIRAVCSALVYLHEQPGLPVLHLDVSPSNILLDETGRIWLIDFGIAEQSDGRRREFTFGKRDYSPPEQWAGQAEPRSDVYALAVTLEVLLTGKLPGAPGSGGRPAPVPVPPAAMGTTMISAPGSQGVAPAQPVLHPDIAALIDRALAPDPTKRPTSRVLLEALDAIIASRELPPPPPPARMPAVPAILGRVGASTTIEATLRAQGVAVLVGPAGIGKTTLVVGAAAAWGLPERVFWHRFRAGDGAEALLWALAGFLEWRGTSGPWRFVHSSRRIGGEQPPLAMVLDYLVQAMSGGRYLIALDDLHLGAEDPELGTVLARLVTAARTSALALLASSRRRPDEFVPEEGIVSVEGLDATAAAALLTRADLTLDPAVVERLHALTEGNPQLLLLAAEALARARDPARLIENLPAHERIEGYLLREVDNALADEERQIMRALSLLPGYGGTRQAVEAILDGASVRRPLRAMADRSLLSTGEGPYGREYRPHAMVQTFYADELGAAQRTVFNRRAGAFYAEEEPAPLRAATHYVGAGDDAPAAALIASHWADMINSGQARALGALIARLRADRLPADSRAALALVGGRVAGLLGQVDQAQHAFETALAALGPTPGAGEPALVAARAHRELARLVEQCDDESALAHIDQGLALVSGTAPTDEAELLIVRGATLMYRGNYAAAAEALGRALELAGDVPSRLRAAVLLNLSGVTAMEGDLSASVALAEEALGVSKAFGDEYQAVRLLANLGIWRFFMGEWAAAIACLAEGLALAERLGDAHGVVGLHGSLGLCYAGRGDHTRAVEHTERALELARAQRLDDFAVVAAYRLAELSLRAGDLERADGLLRDAETRAGPDDRENLPAILAVRSELHLAEGSGAAALGCAEQAVALLIDDDDPVVRGIIVRARGSAHLALGQIAVAQADFHASLELIGDGDPYERARTYAALAAALPPEEAATMRSLARETFAALGAQYDLKLLELAGHHNASAASGHLC